MGKLAVVLILTLASIASASPITYDISGTGSGTTWTPNQFAAPGVSFNNLPFDFHLIADTSNLDEGGALLQADTGSLTLGGVKSAFSFPGTFGGVGLFTVSPGTIDLWDSSNQINDIMDVSSPALASYDLMTTTGPLGVSAVLDPQQRTQAFYIFTDSDVVNFAAVSGVTFTADLSAATPEPVSWALMGLGMAGIGLRRRYRC